MSPQGVATACASRRRGCAGATPSCRHKANRIANVLVHDMGLLPGNRVLLRAPNNPMLAACWFGVVKAGGIAVGSMPLLRAKELKQIIDKAQISHALCDLRLADELKLARTRLSAAARDALLQRRRRRLAWKRRWPASAATATASTTSTPPPTTPA